MKVLFFRSRTTGVKIQKPDATRAFVFDVHLGLSRGEPQVDALSGMLVPLPSVDQMLADTATMWADVGERVGWSSLKELLEKTKEFFEARSGPLGVSVEEVNLVEKRGFWLKWRPGLFLIGQELIHEIDNELYRLRVESTLPVGKDNFPADLDRLEYRNLKELLSEEVFLKNPDLQNLEVESLASGEKWHFYRE